MSRPTEFYFNFYGIGLTLEGVDEGGVEVSRLLCDDFAYFLGTLPSRASLKIPLKISLQSQGQLPPSGKKWFKTRMAEARGWGSQRVCLYGSEAWTRNQETQGRRTLDVHASDLRSLYEVGYIAILSAVGEALDGQGFHRLHALGFEYQNQAILVFGDSGAGKSALAYQILRHTDWKIFSDETPLYSKGRVYSFPTRLALQPDVLLALGGDPSAHRSFTRKIYSEKKLVPIPPDRVASPNPLGRMFMISNRPWNWGREIVRLVLGVGYAQMAEQVLRGTNFLDLGQAAWGRLKMTVDLRSHHTQVSRLSPESHAQRLFENLQIALKNESLEK